MSETVRGIMPVNHGGQVDALALFRSIAENQAATFRAVMGALGIEEDVACGRDPVEACRELAARVDALTAEIARLSDKLARIRGLCTHKPQIAEQLGCTRFVMSGRPVIDVIDGKP